MGRKIENKGTIRMKTKTLVDDLVSFYGESPLVPSRLQWSQLISSEHEGPICMVNFMRFREVADYPDGEASSGMEAMMRYQEVAHKKVISVGGEFLAAGLFGGMMIGESEDWDAVGIVRYPNKRDFIRVFSDPEYRSNHYHRLAGTLRHRMAILME